MENSFVPPFVTEWRATLRPLSLRALAPDPTAVAVFSADMINGFVHHGPLSSQRVRDIAEPVASLFRRAWDHGVREFVLLQDTHSPATPEFRSYPPHCLAGTSESQTIPELATLDFADAFTIVEKNALPPDIGTGFDKWLDHHPGITTAIVVGNCTDLCTYSLAMRLRLRANALNLPEVRVVVPVDCVDTFDIPWSIGENPGMAHPGDFFHEVFLYHMAQNGVEIVSTIAP